MNQKALHNITIIAIFSSLSFVLMMFKIPVFFAPNFYSMDLSEIFSIAIGINLSMGLGILITLFKNVIHLFFTNTYFVGELANFLISTSFIVSVCYINKKIKNKKSIYIALFCGIIVTSILGALLNMFVLLPFYSKFYPIEAIIKLASSINAFVYNYTTFVIFAIIPFNLLKYSILSVVTVIINSKIKNIIKCK